MAQHATDTLLERDPDLWRRLVTWPLGLVAGAFVAGVALTRWQTTPLVALGCGLLTAWLATRARAWLELRVQALLEPESASAALLALAVDVALGAAVGLAASSLFGASAPEAIGSGAGLAGLWSWIVGRVFAGRGVDRAVDFLLGGAQHTDYALEPILADGEALEREGQPDAAIRKYRQVAQRTPADPEPYLRAARLLRQEGRAGEAAGLLREARRHAHINSGQELLISRELATLAAGPLGDPAAAAAELALLAARFRGTPAGKAASAELTAMRGTAAQSAAGAIPPGVRT